MTAPVSERPTPVLVALGSPLLRDRVACALRALGCEASFDGHGPAGAPSLFVVGAQSLHLRPLPFPPERTLVVGAGEDRAAAIALIAGRRLCHYVPADDGALGLLEAGLLRLVEGRSSAAALLGPSPAALELTDSAGKAAAIAQVQEVALSAGAHPRQVELLGMAAEEMIVNALFRAPAPGAAREPVRVRVGQGEGRLTIAVADGHGRLEPGDLHASLDRALSRRARGVPAEARSGSLGLRTMLEALCELVIEVEPGVRTELWGTLELGAPLAEARLRPPALGLLHLAPR